MSTTSCPICGFRIDEADWQERPGGRDGNSYSCYVCGNFQISRILLDMLKNKEYSGRLHILSGVIANATKGFNSELFNDLIISAPMEGTNIELHTGNIENLIKNAPAPANPVEMMNRWLLLMMNYSTQAHIAQFIDTRNTYSYVYAHSQRELEHIIEWLVADGLLERDAHPRIGHLRLTKNGWIRALELSKASTDSNQAFVATWFDDSMDSIFSDGIKPALEATGYQAIWMKSLQHNGKIDDRIFAEIRRSGLLIADFTGNRGGVYYEAGFAQGLGIPVVWMCKNDSDEIRELHFDTRQYNHILWNDASDLQTKLIDRIEASIPGRASKRSET